MGANLAIQSYYLAPVLRSSGITSQDDITLINGILQIWNMIVAMTGANLVSRVGRRPLLLASTCGMLAAMIAWTLSGSLYAEEKSKAVGAGILTCVVFFITSYNIAWNPLAVAYPVEILPFTIRAKGVALLMGSIKGASFFNQFVNPIALEAIGWKYYIVYCVWLAIALLTVFFMFPETKVRFCPNIPLEDSLLTSLQNLTLEQIAGVFAAKYPAENVEDEKVTQETIQLENANRAVERKDRV